MSCMMLLFYIWLAILLVIFVIPSTIRYILRVKYPNYAFGGEWMEDDYFFRRYEKYAKMFNQKKCAISNDNLRYLKTHYRNIYPVFTKMYEIKIFKLFLIYIQEEGIFKDYFDYVYSHIRTRNSILYRGRMKSVRNEQYEMIFDITNIYCRGVKNMLPVKFNKLVADWYCFYKFMIQTQNMYELPSYKEIILNRKTTNREKVNALMRLGDGQFENDIQKLRHIWNGLRKS